MNKIELKQIFLVINNCYPNFTIDDVKTEIWLSILKEIPFARAQENLRDHIKKSSYIPTPADIAKPEPQEYWIPDLPSLEERQAEEVRRLENKAQAIDPPDYIRRKWMK